MKTKIFCDIADFKTIEFYNKKIVHSQSFIKRIYSGKYKVLYLMGADEINFDKSSTAITYGKRNFIYDFLSSMRQKINDPLGVRKKRREEGQ